MEDHYRLIYRDDAARYERLIAREDQRGNLFQTLMEIHPFSGKTVVEFGAGTGRITRIMSVLAGFIYAFDIAPAMLREGSRVLRETGMTNWEMAIANSLHMPVASAAAEIAVEGWSFAHVMGWYPDTWQSRTDRMLAEMQRVLKPGGTMILIETMGTGNRTPRAPRDQLATLYRYWEQHHGLNYRWIRTDYQFASVAEADELMRAFFGDAMADELVAGKHLIIPECTGVWWKTV